MKENDDFSDLFDLSDEDIEEELRDEPAAPVAPPPVKEEVQAPAPAPVQETIDYRARELERLSGLYGVDPAAWTANQPQALQQLLARTHFEAVNHAYQLARAHMAEQLPQLMRQHTERTELRSQFFSAHPHLHAAVTQNPQMEQGIWQLAAQWRAQNPTIPLQDAIKTVGDLASRFYNVAPARGNFNPSSAAPTRYAEPVLPPNPAPGRVAGTVAPSNPFADLLKYDGPLF